MILESLLIMCTLDFYILCFGFHDLFPDHFIGICLTDGSIGIAIAGTDVIVILSSIAGAEWMHQRQAEVVQKFLCRGTQLRRSYWRPRMEVAIVVDLRLRAKRRHRHR